MDSLIKEASLNLKENRNLGEQITCLKSYLVRSKSDKCSLAWFGVWVLFSACIASDVAWQPG